MLVVSLGMLALVLRNIFGASNPRGILAGRVAMIVFAGLATYFLFTAHQGRVRQGNPDAIFAAQRYMIGSVLAMLLSAYSVGVQRRKLDKKQAAGKPQPPTSEV
jgi:hypothetical protein